MTTTEQHHTEQQAPINDLTPYPGNARHGNVELIAESLQRLGQYRPIVVNRGTHTGRANEVLAGNHTLEAARTLGWSTVAVTWVDVDDDTARRIVLVDNRSNDMAGYDNRRLAALLEALPDFEATGYTQDDLDALLAKIPDPTPKDPDDAPSMPAAARSKEGDVWICGDHRVMCGNARIADHVARLVDGTPADMMWTDPPYGVDYVGKTADQLTIVGDQASGLSELLLDAFTNAIPALRPGAPVYVAHADTERATFETALRQVGMIVRQNLVWVKNTIVMGRSDYHYQHEPILAAETAARAGSDAEAPAGGAEGHIAGKTHTPILYGFTPGGTGRLGRGGTRWWGDNAQSTVFEYPKPVANREHPTMKPVALIEAMVTNSCRPGGRILDLFAGSGSTMIAAHNTGRRSYLMELDPKYVDVICRRWQEYTGDLPMHADTGERCDFQ